MSFRNRSALSILALTATLAPAAAQTVPVTISVDANANRHPISPLIYGIAYGSTTVLNDLNCPLNRYGGNNASRYNWQLNADNRGNDYYFESIADPSPTPGERGDTFLTTSRAGNAEAMLTVPTIGWVAKVGAARNKLCSFSLTKYGLQTGYDALWYQDAGNGVSALTLQNLVGTDPNDANVPSTSAFQQGWINHLVSAWGKAANGGVKYFVLDNEPSIWFGTHRDVHPVGPTMAEVRDKMVDYAKKIKAVDPAAQVVGPEEWGWNGYFWSGYDQQYTTQHGYAYFPDRTNNGNADYLPWLLSQMKQKSAAAGVRLLDVFSVHYYPQGGEYGTDITPSTQSLRNRSTRSLWDPNYTDTSWINANVQLIPRLKS